MTTSSFRPSPATSPAPHLTTSSSDTRRPHERLRSIADSDGAHKDSFAKPELTKDTAPPATSYPPYTQASVAGDASPFTNQELQALEKSDEISQTESELNYEEGEEVTTTSDKESETSEEEVNDDSGHVPDNIDPFQHVLKVIDLEALAAIALKTRKAGETLRAGPSIPPHLPGENMSCSVDPNSVGGSYNIVYFIAFSDGVKWIARVPGKGPFFTELDVRKMNSDYQTMRHILSSTSIPVPDVFLWSTSSGEVGTPYALMSFVEGSPLSERWFDETWSTEQKRLKALSGISGLISQLHALRFDKFGSVEFDEASKQHTIGPTFWQEEDFDNPWGATHTTGPWDSMTEYLLHDWEALKEEVKGVRIADLAVIRLAVESIPSYMRGNGRFYLQHADFNYQNILIDDDANITGIIDWDGSHTVPCSMGFGRYPSWLTRDWDPAMYGYDEEDDPPVDPSRDSPPEELSRYRQHYSLEFQKLNLHEYDPRQTRLSHIVEAIKIACNSRMSRDWIVPKLLDHAFYAKLPFKHSAFDEAYSAGAADEMMEQIRQAFKSMWHAEWEASQDGGEEEEGKDSRSDAREKMETENGDDISPGKKVRLD
jgi:aminoglycoside phosphotransferase (APT) family kinase protein